jgi:flagellar biosynthesis chaperone FliJ
LRWLASDLSGRNSRDSVSAFKFSLQTLLDHRERVERERAAAVAGARLALDAARAELVRLHNELAQGTLPVQAARIDALQRAVEECSDRWELARRELEIAHRERLQLEKLKARRFETFSAELARREELELDEANAQAKLRQQRGARIAE